ncbi:NB-ARC domain-containing protein [Micromonospora zamorensis]|uniref:NB-ARC domain-containing protein n=1 Tax=Micromonospora zamorensis TaxID=709883 RepID=UPI003CF9EE2C
MLRAVDRDAEERRSTLDELSSRFRSAVADRRLLILLDDAVDVAQARPLTPAGAGCLTLVTSRRLMADQPGAAVLTVDALPPGQALKLLTATVGADRVAADPSGARRLVGMCAGLPLAASIVGSRLPVAWCRQSVVRGQHKAGLLWDRPLDPGQRAAFG